MHNHKLLCPICGREVEKLYEGVCKECFINENELFSIPQVIDIVLCRDCGSYMIGKSWIHNNKNLTQIIEEHVLRNLKVDSNVNSFWINIKLFEEDEKNYNAEVIVGGEIYDFSFEQSKYVRIRIHKALCDVCSRRYSGYYEAIIQLRGPDSPVIEALEEIRREFENNIKEFILKEERVKGGINVYVSSYKLARKIVRKLHDEYGGEIKETATLHTRKEGKDVYRFTYLYRVPEYYRGSVLMDSSGRVFVVKKIFGKSIDLIDLVYGKERKEYVEEIKKKYKIIHAKPYEAQILYFISENEVSILDPQTYAEHIVRLLSPIDRAQTKLKVVKIENNVYHYPFP